MGNTWLAQNLTFEQVQNILAQVPCREGVGAMVSLLSEAGIDPDPYGLDIAAAAAHPGCDRADWRPGDPCQPIPDYLALPDRKTA